MKQFHVAIDGPSASGKSTISSMLAKALNLIHVDTGAMYRAVTLYALRHQLNLEDENSYTFLEYIHISYDQNAIYIDDEDVSNEIRTKVVTDKVSLVSSFKYVRKKMVDIQQKASIGKRIIMDGRDIGSVVLPHADLKIFLSADAKTRAKRRFAEMSNQNVNLEDVLEDLIRRDYLDSTRDTSPLIRPSDAIDIDSGNKTIEEVVIEIKNLIEKKEKEKNEFWIKRHKHN